jgi:hypothetical protein
MQDNNNIIRQLKVHYYGNVILLAIFFVLVFFRVISFGSGEMTVSYALEVYAILITLLVIPLSLKQFSVRLKKLPRPSEKSVAEKVYKNAFFLRLYPLSVAALGNIALFGLTRNVEVAQGHDTFWFGINNFLWFSIIILAVFAFCKPSAEELEKLSETTATAAQTQQSPSEAETQEIMWWEKGKEKSVPIDSVISENIQEKNEKTT